MIQEKLDQPVKLPWDEEALSSRDTQRFIGYMLKLVRTLEELLEKITVNTNSLTDLTDGDAVYWGLKDEKGEYPDGTWRRIKVGVNLEDQVRIDGDWVFVQRRERPV